MKKLTIVMVTRNAIEDVKKALESLNKYTDKNKYKLLIYDNGSDDFTNAWVADYCKENEVECKYQYCSENRGWISAINNAYDICDTEYILTCHSDVIFSKQWLENMMRRFDDKKVAAIGPVISFALGQQSVNLAYRTFGAEVNLLLGLFFLCRIDVLREVRDTYYKGKEYLSPDYCLGDKEEFELCYMIKELGYKLEIARDVYIEHAGEKTFVSTLGSKQAFYDYQNENYKILVDRIGQAEVDKMYKVEINKPLKIMIGIVSRTEYIHFEFVISLLKIWQATNLGKMFFFVGRGHIQDRNKIIESFKKSDCTHLLFLDDDMIFTGEDLIKLLSHDVDICTGNAWQRGEPHAPCIFLANEKLKTVSPFDNIGNGLIEIDACGAYFLLIKRRVLENMSDEYFKYGDTTWAPTGVGEDVGFCIKAKLAGTKIYCDTDVEIKHIGRNIVIGKEFYLQLKDSGELQKMVDNINEFKKM